MSESHRITACPLRTVLLLIAIAFAACQTSKPPRSPSQNAPSEAGTILPQPDRLVTDTAGVLTSEDIAALEADLISVDQRGLAQMLIYITPSIPTDEIMEDLTLRTANAWGVGRAGIDDGLVVFVLSMTERCESSSGRGLESAISNEAAGRVIIENIAPAFRRGAYREGLQSAIQELARLLAPRSSVISRNAVITF